ncbi:hypothetical protein HDU83_008921 [Entophlyctis luteolus]|nr:hypothetical protein HDU83_008921 [Entophlyctis luteolus]
MRRADIVIAAGTMASITLLQLIYLVSFILRKELPLKKKMLSPFNISLVSLLLSLLGQFLCEMSTFVVDHPSPYSYAILLVFAATFEFCYLFYCYARGFSLVVELHPKLALFLTYTFYFLPLILYLSPVFAGLQSYYSGTPTEKFYADLSTAWTFTSGAFSIVVDVIILASFIQFLRKTSLNHHVDQKFRIISKYGIACSAWAFMALTLFTIFGIFGDHMILVGVGITFSAMATLLVAMKVALFTEETAKTGSTLGISHLSPKGVIS